MNNSVIGEKKIILKKKEKKQRMEKKIKRNRNTNSLTKDVKLIGRQCVCE